MKASLLAGSFATALVLSYAAVDVAPAGAQATSQARSGTAAEDARLLAFLDKAFDDALALSPESLTALGSKQDYNKLDDYTDAGEARQQALAEQSYFRFRCCCVPASRVPRWCNTDFPHGQTAHL